MSLAVLTEYLPLMLVPLVAAYVWRTARDLDAFLLARPSAQRSRRPSPCCCSSRSGLAAILSGACG